MNFTPPIYAYLRALGRQKEQSSRARNQEQGEHNSEHFLNLEKQSHAEKL